MKKVLLFALLIPVFFACNGPKGEKVDAKDSLAIADSLKNVEATYAVVTDSTSRILWHGTKPTGEHKGFVALKEGKIQTKGGEIIGGKFVIDMESITDLDLTDAKMNAKLVGHLKSADFFVVDTFKVAEFEIASVTKMDKADSTGATHEVSGNLKIKNTTKGITIKAKIENSGDAIKVSTAQFVIDRTQWGVVYQSKTLAATAKDKAISDEIGITIVLNTKKEAAPATK